MDNYNYLKNKIDEVGYLYKHDLLKDFMKDDYRKNDYLYNFYTCCVEGIENYRVAKSIFELLWEWTGDKEDKESDVMNSFVTYMNKIVDDMIGDQKYDKDGLMKNEKSIFIGIVGSTEEYQKTSERLVRYFIRNNEIKKMMKKNSKQLMKKISQFSKWSNTIGNFVLLPNTKDFRIKEIEKKVASENTYKNNIGDDRMDIYLYYLKNQYYEHNLEAFKNYINENYLWDYVDNNYNVIPLFPNSDNTKNEIEKNLPNDHISYIVFAKNVSRKIKRRGMFMEIMILLKIEAKVSVEDYKKIKSACSYMKALREIEVIRKDNKINLSENLKTLINELYKDNLVDFINEFF
jgi:hypothetical protein